MIQTCGELEHDRLRWLNSCRDLKLRAEDGSHRKDQEGKVNTGKTQVQQLSGGAMYGGIQANSNSKSCLCK